MLTAKLSFFTDASGATRLVQRWNNPGFKRAAGIQIVDPDGRMLFVKRSPWLDHPGTWAFPGGRLEYGESPEAAARRETAEETGQVLTGLVYPIGKTTERNIEFHTYRNDIDRMFMPQLNWEHTDFVWARLPDAPQPLHPGVARLLGVPPCRARRSCLSRLMGLIFRKSMKWLSLATHGWAGMLITRRLQISMKCRCTCRLQNDYLRNRSFTT